MPLVRIDLIKRPDPTFARNAGAVVYESMRNAINVPEHDNFQVLCEHEAGHFVFDTKYLGIERIESTLFIQITLNEGRTVEQKKLLYRTIVEGLKHQLDVRPEDVLINLVEVKKENWSFGNGIAQYAD